MMGVPISVPSYVYGDNMTVIHNTQRLESTLKKEVNSSCYHSVCESIVMGNENCDSLSTKVLYGGKRRFCVSNFLYNIYDAF